MQSDWKCCGINKPDDWDLNVYFNTTSKDAPGTVESSGVPFSCCLPSIKYREENLPNQACGYNVRDEIYVNF